MTSTSSRCDRKRKRETEVDKIDVAGAIRVSAEFERAGKEGIIPAIALLIGFKKIHSSALSPMELVRLHCRCASLYRMYTENRQDERHHLNLAVNALDKDRSDSATELHGHLLLWRADLFICENKLRHAAKEIEEALAAFGATKNRSYAFIKRSQLSLIGDDIRGAIDACLEAIAAEKQEQKFSATRTLCRILVAHLYMRYSI
jgi:hypothetical protein